MRGSLGIVLVLALAAGAAAQDDAAKIDALERRLEQQQRDLQQLQEELRRMKEGAGSAADPLAPGGAEVGPADPARTQPIEAAPPGVTAGEHPIRIGLFYVESLDGRHRLDINGRLMVDGRFDPERDDDDVDDHFQVRRGRMEFSGRIYEHVTFKLGLEFGRTSDADFRDAWLDLAVTEWFRVRAGQMLLPFSTERQVSSNTMKFPERPIIITNIADSREVGLMLHGRAFGGVLAYYAGIYNGNGANHAKDDDDDKDLVLRLEVAPIKPLLLAASYRYTPTNREDSRGPIDVHTVGDQLTRFLDYDTVGNRHEGHRERGTVDVGVRVGSLEVKGELVFDYWREMRSAAGGHDDLMHWGWFVDAAYVLTGEESAGTIEPASPFWGEHGLGTGAFELSLRYEEFHADRAALREGFATGTRTARSSTVCLTWIPVARVRALLSYTYTDFEDLVVDSEGNRHDDDHAVVGRLGFWF